MPPPDGLTLWEVRVVSEDPVRCDVVSDGDVLAESIWPGDARALVTLHNRQVEWSRVTLAAEKAAGRPTLSRQEVEAALTRMAAAVAVEVAKQLGPWKVLRWVFGTLRRTGPRPPAATPMTRRPTPPPAA